MCVLDKRAGVWKILTTVAHIDIQQDSKAQRLATVGDQRGSGAVSGEGQDGRAEKVSRRDQRG